MSGKNPQTPPAPLTAEPTDFTTSTDPLWRIHRTTGAYRQRWDEMRTVGPLVQMRWDPHHLPHREEPPPARAVAYTAADVLTAFGETFQARRRIVLSEHQALVSWVPTRPLRLLNLLPPTSPTGTSWALRNGASASLDSAPKSTCRAWARSIADTWPDLDGIHVRSTVTGQPMVTLFTPAATAYPVDPAYSRRLDDTAVAAIAVHVATTLNWTPPVRD